MNKTLVYDDTSDGTRTWRHAVNVNLVAVIDGTRIAVSLPLFVKRNCQVDLSVTQIVNLYQQLLLVWHISYNRQIMLAFLV